MVCSYKKGDTLKLTLDFSQDFIFFIYFIYWIKAGLIPENKGMRAVSQKKDSEVQ